ncbi:MAG TPA: rod shape-determining protein MreC [Candidatus Limnocylindrales bacterium]|nr:rod shape-determining protein MreC [Candidatus Limnocylindrales bacterium]
MTALLNDRRTRRRSITYVVLLVTCLVLMVFSSSPPIQELQRGVAFAFKPVQTAVDSVAQGIGSVVATIGEIDTLRKTNDQLATENATLQAQNAQAQELERENQILTGLLKVQSSLGYTSIGATVIGRETSEFRRVITLDVGTDRGISVGDVVVAEGGALAGRVTDVTGDTASVLLINDTTSTVIGQLATNAATGSVIGQLGGVLVMENIDSTERVQINDQVVTAGIDLGNGVRSPFPKGLVIGTVVDDQRDANAVVQTAFIEPAVDLDKLEYVLVITNYKGGLPPIDQQAVPCPTGSATLPVGEQPCLSASPAPTSGP